MLVPCWYRGLYVWLGFLNQLRQMSKARNFGERGRRLKRVIGLECVHREALILQSNSKFVYNFVIYVRNSCRACNKKNENWHRFWIWLKVASVTKKAFNILAYNLDICFSRPVVLYILGCVQYQLHLKVQRKCNALQSLFVQWTEQLYIFLSSKITIFQGLKKNEIRHGSKIIESTRSKFSPLQFTYILLQSNQIPW